MDFSAVGLITLVSAGAIDLCGLWHREVWGQVPAGAGCWDRSFALSGGHAQRRTGPHSVGCCGTDDSDRICVVQAGESLDLPWRGTEECCPQMCFPLSDEL